MTFEEMVARIPELSITERKELISIIVDSLATTPEPKHKKQRIPDMHKGGVWMSDDFDDELPDSFWFGDDEE